MKKLLLITASIAALASGSAIAADMPLKAPPAPVGTPYYDWSGFYLGVQGGGEWARVRDTTTTGYLGNSRLEDGVVGVHGGAQVQFGRTPWGSWLVGVEASLYEPTDRNSTSNFAPCPNPVFTCGLTNINDLTTVGGRLGLTADRLLLTVSGGWARGALVRGDFLPAAGLLNSGGGFSIARHNGDYVGAGLEYVLSKGTFFDLIGGLDYKRVWLNSKTDINANAVGHTLSANMDVFTARVTVKFNPFTR